MAHWKPSTRNSLSAAGVHQLKSETFGTTRSSIITPSSNNMKTKLNDLSAKLHDMDLDLAHQTKNRSLNQSKVETLQQELTLSLNAQKRLQGLLVDAEDRLQRLENLVTAEQSSREQAGPRVQRMLDDKLANVVALLEKEVQQRNFGADVLKQKVRDLEDRNKQLEFELVESRKQLSTLNDTNIAKLNASLASLHQANSKQKSSKGSGEESDELAKRFSVQIQNLQTDLNSERFSREHETSMARRIMETEIVELRAMLEAEKKERATMSDNIVAPVWAEFRKIQDDIAKEVCNREQSVSDKSQTIIDRINSVRVMLEKAAVGIEEQQVKKFKDFEDSLWKLNSKFQAQVESTNSSVSAMRENLEFEKQERGQSEEQVLRILDTLSEKLMRGLLAHQ